MKRKISLKRKISAKRNQFWNWNLKLEPRVLLHTTHGGVQHIKNNFVHFEKMQNSQETCGYKSTVRVCENSCISDNYCGTVAFRWMKIAKVTAWGRSAPSWHGWTKCNTWKHWSKLRLQSEAAMPIYIMFGSSMYYLLRNRRHLDQTLPIIWISILTQHIDIQNHCITIGAFKIFVFTCPY